MFVKQKSEQISELYAETDFVNLQVEGKQEDCLTFGFHSQDSSQQREAFSRICPAQQCLCLIQKVHQWARKFLEMYELYLQTK